MILKACNSTFSFPRPAMVMGILNVTPDSFSDGGQYLEPGTAVDRVFRMIEGGAEIIDIGGESTRPGALEVPVEEELRRVIPVLERLAGRVSVPISIDTRKPAVAREALKAGATIINDVQANRGDTEMWELAAQSGAGYVCMHMSGTPRTMQEQPSYANVVEEVAAFFFQRITQMRRCGLAAEQIILDPGIGFGKTVAHNLQLLGCLERFHEFGRPLLVGVSRKSFLGKLLDVPVDSRLAGGLACASLAVAAGAAIVRTHDVGESVQAMRVTEAILASRLTKCSPCG